jgi:hypothetical protein
MSTPQEYWDACLIRVWRKEGTIHDVFSLFYSVTGKKTNEFELVRLPRYGLPTGMSIRIFTAQFLPKINDWLWDKAPDKDVALLKKLSTSKYNTLDKPFMSGAEKALKHEQDKLKKNRLRNGMRTLEYTNRNQATEWGVTKGASSKTGGRTRRLG